MNIVPGAVVRWKWVEVCDVMIFRGLKGLAFFAMETYFAPRVR